MNDLEQKVLIAKFNENLHVYKQIPLDTEVVILPPKTYSWVVAYLPELNLLLVDYPDDPLPVQKYAYYLTDYEIEFNNGYNVIVGMAYAVIANKLLVSVWSD